MQIIERGNPSIMQSIAKSAKHVSQCNGLADLSLTNKPPIPMPTLEGGAYASMQRRTQATPVSSSIGTTSIERRNVVSDRPKSSITGSGLERRLKDRLLESVETLGITKEYFNATSSLLTLYALGELTEGVMSSMDREDIKEIKGIIREFKSVLDRY